MKLRTKTLLAMSVTLVSLIGALYATALIILKGNLQHAEQENTLQVVRGVLNVWTQTQEAFTSRCAEWSVWDDTYTFIKKPNKHYVQSNLLPNELANLKINLVLFIDSSGRIVFGTGFDWKNQQKTPIPGIVGHLSPNDLLLQHHNVTSSLTGILMFPEGPMLVTSQPIVTSKAKGPIRGTIIFGRLLNNVALEKLVRGTKFSITAYPVDRKQIPTDVQEARNSLSAPSPADVVIRPLNSNSIAAYTLLNDIYARPALVLRVSGPRQIYNEGKNQLHHLILAVLVVGLVFGGISLLLLERLVLARLAYLSAGVKTIGKQEDPLMRLLPKGNDELATLTNAINGMLDALLHSQQQLQKTLEEIRYEKARAENLLLNILPQPIADRLKLDETTIADNFTDVTVLFADIVGFTKLATYMPPKELVDLLNQVFSAFDLLAERHGLEKIKTIGDAYMVVGGLPVPRSDHAEAIAEMALDMQKSVVQFNTNTGEPFSMRIGINTGPVVAGVIGLKKFIYDLWGDTVNTASRMESHGLPGCIQVTGVTYELLQDKYLFTVRGAIQVKGKGEMTTYLLTGRKVS